MILTLTDVQAEQFHAHRACVVPGPVRDRPLKSMGIWPYVELEDGESVDCLDRGVAGDLSCFAKHPRRAHRRCWQATIDFTPWRVANEPCPCACHKLNSAFIVADCRCRDGKPIIELRVFDPGVRFKRASAFVVVARATVTLLPVVTEDQGRKVPVPRVEVTDQGLAILFNRPVVRTLGFDPLPVPGRDWVAVLTDVEVP